MLHLADDFHLSMVERMPFLHLEGLGSTSTSAQAAGLATTADLSFLPNGQSWQLLRQTSQLLIWKNIPNISRKTVWPRIFDYMSQLQIMIFLFDADLILKPAISIQIYSKCHLTSTAWGSCLRHARICPCISSKAAVAAFNLGQIRRTKRQDISAW